MSSFMLRAKYAAIDAVVWLSLLLIVILLFVVSDAVIGFLLSRYHGYLFSLSVENLYFVWAIGILIVGFLVGSMYESFWPIIIAAFIAVLGIFAGILEAAFYPGTGVNQFKELLSVTTLSVYSFFLIFFVLGRIYIFFSRDSYTDFFVHFLAIIIILGLGFLVLWQFTVILPSSFGWYCNRMPDYSVFCRTIHNQNVLR